ncbi:MAG TPA: GTP 3',8-cyclase MoaA [Phycisphaerales bacterium]|nr:GTP 3',8-cyclase MoaA [Phycisphaerales bacterium]HCD32669.1 GTP 3',8-cyclase MoaA [Phycisphaerales bacterium]
MPIALPVISSGPVRPNFAQGPRSLSALRLLRLSVTDRCNLRCMYCMPQDGLAFAPKSDSLAPSEIIAVAKAAMNIGVSHLKLTGGEPTIRHDLLDIVRGLAALKPHDLSMTTNGLSLHRQAAQLRDAGVDRLTISWDSMQPQRLARITGSAFATDPPNLQYDRGMKILDQLQAGIDAAIAAGFEKLKINTVVIGNVNDDEVADFARLTIENNWTVRFIEYMPLGESQLTGNYDQTPSTVDNALVIERIQNVFGQLESVDRQSEAGVGPAQLYSLHHAAGRLGFISAMSQPFCETCNRLRMTAKGELRACLFDGGEVDVIPALRPKVDPKKLIELMEQCVVEKPETHSMHGNRQMSQLGG